MLSIFAGARASLITWHTVGVPCAPLERTIIPVTIRKTRNLASSLLCGKLMQFTLNRITVPSVMGDWLAREPCLRRYPEPLLALIVPHPGPTHKHLRLAEDTAGAPPRPAQ
jgi:hypothetical protein